MFLPFLHSFAFAPFWCGLTGTGSLGVLYSLSERSFFSASLRDMFEGRAELSISRTRAEADEAAEDMLAKEPTDFPSSSSSSSELDESWSRSKRR